MQGDIPNNLLQSLAGCDKDSFPNIHSLLVLACTLPIASAEVERSFSLMRKIKTTLRSTMTLSDLAVIAIVHYGEKVTTDVVQTYPRRLFFSVSSFD